MNKSVANTTRAFYLTTIFAIAIPTLTIWSADFDVSGHYEIKYVRRDTVVLISTNEFQGIIRGCKSYYHIEKHGQGGIDYNEFYSEPDKCYILTRFSKTNHPGVRIANEQSIEVYARPIPFCPDSVTLMSLWVAFGSTCYFDTIKGNLIDPPYVQILPTFFQEPPRTFGDKSAAEWRKDKMPPYLLSHLLLFRDGKSLGYKHPYDIRMTNTIYEALSFTNIDGLSFPSLARISIFPPDPESKDQPKFFGPGSVYLFTKEVKTRDLRDFKFAPEVNPKTRILDYRFCDETGNPNPVAYIAKEGRILDRDELMLLTGANKPQFSNVYEDKAKWPMYLISVGIATLSISAFLGLCVAYRKMKRKG